MSHSIMGYGILFFAFPCCLYHHFCPSLCATDQIGRFFLGDSLDVRLVISECNGKGIQFSEAGCLKPERSISSLTPSTEFFILAS